MSTENRILLYPAFTERERLIDELARAVWYFEPIRDVTPKIYVLVRGLPITTAEVDAMLGDFAAVMPAYFDSEIAEWAKRWTGRIEVHPDPDGNLESSWSVPGTSIILCWELQTPERYDDIMKIGERCGIIYTFASVTKNIGEAANRARIVHERLRPERKSAIYEAAPKVLQKLKEDFAGREVYVYGSGPSVSQVIDAKFDFGDGCHIVCNSLIKNDELMDIVRPKIVVCADPVFHAGPSEYAAEFRRTLNRFLHKHDAHVVTLVDYVATICSALDESHWDRVIGVSQGDMPEDNLNLIDNQTVRPTENILTLLMLPLAMTLTDKISILGCDGRSFVQDSYFWKHDTKSQFGDLMEGAKLTHPAFFKRDFNDYYIAHCQVLERLFVSGERAGKRIRMITPSYLPPLAKRYEAVI
ncbi:MAG: hypothetical protein RIC16_03575 [Rhodospirillales bacterium]